MASASKKHRAHRKACRLLKYGRQFMIVINMKSTKHAGLITRILPTCLLVNQCVHRPHSIAARVDLTFRDAVIDPTDVIDHLKYPEGRRYSVLIAICVKQYLTA